MLPFKISVLIFVSNDKDEQLLIQRRKAPNEGLWSPIGGKLEMPSGESPFECAIREAKEEIGIDLEEKDLHLFGMIAEKSYEGTGHWLMFMFDCRKKVNKLPPQIDEGRFAFYSKEAIENLPIPATDKEALWPLYYDNRHRFVALRANCHPDGALDIIVEQTIG